MHMRTKIPTGTRHCVQAINKNAQKIQNDEMSYPVPAFTTMYTGSNQAEDLDDSNNETEVKPREFFWDNIVLFVVSSIIGLAAVEAVTEYIRGGDVSCFSPAGEELSEAQEAYINNYCAGFLPLGAYIPAFMIIHATLILLPHYLWCNHHGGNFDFFFKLASLLKRLQDAGEHAHDNLVIVGQLESTFNTYGQNKIFTLYVVKLLTQLVASLSGIGFVSSFFFQSFDSNFMCPRNFSNSTDDPFWPFDSDVVCVFEALKFLHTIWFAEVGLLGLLTFSLLWALVWCFTTHSNELGAKTVAQFSFQSGLAPTYYVPSLPVPDRCKTGCRWLLYCFTSIPWLSSSGRIRSDLDFLLMKLFRTDNGLGHVFKEVQIEMELKTLFDDDQRRLHNHRFIQENFSTNSDCDREKDLRDREQDEQDLKWQFTKLTAKYGIYRDFKIIPSTCKLLLTDTLRGVVLGFGQRAPHNKGALSISFGDIGYTTALARVFGRVALLNFVPDYNLSEEMAKVTQYNTNTVSLVFPENILSSQTSDVNKFVENLRTIWIPPGSNRAFSETSFIVVGPIPKEKDFSVTTVDLLFEHIYGCLEDGAVLLTLHPLEINGKNIKNNFLSYEPNKPRFLPLQQTPPIVVGELTEWYARKSALDSVMSSHGALPIDEVAVQAIETQQCSDPSDVNHLPFTFDLRVQCGETKLRVQFSTYRYVKDEREMRPSMFDPIKKRQ